MKGRIQKSKRHKKLKSVDPYYIGDRTNLLDRTSHLSNARPKNDDEQEVPRKLQELIAAKNLLRSNKGVLKKRKKRKKTIVFKSDDFGKKDRGMDHPLKPIPKYIQKHHESDHDFLERVSSHTHAIVAKTQMEAKLGIDIKEMGNGKIEIKKQEKFSLDLPQKLTEKKKKTSEKRVKRREKEKLKRQKKAERKVDDFESFKDDIKFGEVVTRPPTLNIRPKLGLTHTTKNKPGKKPLLLKNLLNKDIKQAVIFPSMQNNAIDRTVKRKMLSVSERRQLENERDTIVAAYRKSKGNSNKTDPRERSMK